MTGFAVTLSDPAPLFIRVDADEFGRLFAGMSDKDQVEVLRAMVHHMRPHRMQWDYLSIELERDQNAPLREELRNVLFPEGGGR